MMTIVNCLTRLLVSSSAVLAPRTCARSVYGTTQLHQVLDKCKTAILDESGIYQKLVDTVPYQRLLYRKLSNYRVGRKALEWIRQLLHGRKQKVRIRPSDYRHGLQLLVVYHRDRYYVYNTMDMIFQ